MSKGISAGNFCSCLLFKIYWDVSIFYNMCVFNLVFKINQSRQLVQVFVRNSASILDIISLNCAPETLRRLSTVLRRLFMIDSTLKCAPETSTCAPETFSVLKFAPAKTCSKSARRGARWTAPTLQNIGFHRFAVNTQAKEDGLNTCWEVSILDSREIYLLI